MPLLKLNRINKGGEIYLNSEQIRFIEIEGRSSTVNMGPGNVYAVEESPGAIAAQLEEMEVARIRNAIIQSSSFVQNKTEVS
ncbi:MAG: hypothetical protein JWR69_4254 [Pedosphaera sp.]|nr:hypothetical protein [Pedosphaera sp.]